MQYLEAILFWCKVHF